MDIAPDTKRPHRGAWAAVTSLVPILAVALLVLYATGHGSFGRHQASQQTDQQGAANPESRPTPSESQTSSAPSAAPIAGLTTAMIERKLPGSWKASFQLTKDSDGRVYRAITTKAGASTQLQINITLKAAKQFNQVDRFNCVLTSVPKPDAASLSIIRQCLRAALPAADAQQAASWFSHAVIGLTGQGALRNFDIDGVVVQLEYLEHALAVMIAGPGVPD